MPKISELTATTSINSTDELPLVQSGNTRKITRANLFTGYYTAAQVDSLLSSKADASSLTAHTGNTSNPHNTTAAQVGNTTAQWNASQLRGVNISTTAPTTGQVLKYDGTNWSPGTDNTGGGSGALDDLTDVIISSPTNGQVLKYNGTTWVNGTDNTGGGGGALDDLTDVIITTPYVGQRLVYNGTNWVNEDNASSQFIAGTGRYYSSKFTSISGQSIGANTGRGMVMQINRRVSIDQLGVNVTTLGNGNTNVAIYEFFSGNLVSDFGDMNTNGTGARTTATKTTPVQIDPGVYIFLLNPGVSFSCSCSNNVINDADVLGRDSITTTAHQGVFVSSMTYTGTAPSTIPSYVFSTLQPVVWFRTA